MTTSDTSTAHEQNLTRQRLAAVRDELIETANILDTVLDGSITQAAAVPGVLIKMAEMEPAKVAPQ